MKIMIVDDSRAMRLMVRKTLREAGYGGNEIVEADDGANALETIRRAVPDLILCDWNMPNMSGLELLQALGGDGPEIDFGFVTTEATSEMRRIATEAGAKFFITKPFTVESFASALDPFINS